MDGVLLQGILAGSMLVTTTVTGLIPLKVRLPILLLNEFL